MKFSLTLPCHKRQADLYQCLPALADAVEAAQPAELVIVDYANPHPMEQHLLELLAYHGIHYPSLVVPRYTGRTTFHMAHARNIGIREATGDVVVIGSSDLKPSHDFLRNIRQRMIETNATWLSPERYCGIIACRRDVLLALGGYDERFEFYGPEDKDLAHRLTRSGVPHASYPVGWIDMLPTPEAMKVQGYRESLTRREMSERGRTILESNDAAGVLAVNEDIPWGSLHA